MQILDRRLGSWTQLYGVKYSDLSVFLFLQVIMITVLVM